MSDQSADLRAVEEQLKQAEATLDLHRLTAKLCEKEGLAYASITGHHLGPMLVTYQHKPIGEIHTTSPSALRDWYAQSYRDNGTLGDSNGPYVNARAAAASLIPGRNQQPDTSSAG